MNFKCYAVRQKSTGLFIPRLANGKRRGGTHLEPSNEREPRLFHNSRSAKAFLGNWLQGIMVQKMTNSLEDVDTYIDVQKQPHRNKEDMEVVEFKLVEHG